MTNARTETDTSNKKYIFIDPPIAQTLFGDWRWAWIWLIIRLYDGYEWLLAGWDKIINPNWVGHSAGKALTGFLNNSISLTSGAHPAVQPQYAAFLKAVILPGAGFWSCVVVFGELLVGFSLVLGLFTGVAAFFGFFMNMNYMLAGSISSNPVLLFLSIFLGLAWKVAGWQGLDRWVLFSLGTLWSPGHAFHEKPIQQPKQRRAEMQDSSLVSYFCSASKMVNTNTRYSLTI